MTTTDLTHDTFKSTIVNNPLVLVDFWAAYCRPCQAFAPIYDRSARSHPDVVHAKVDAQAELVLARFGAIDQILQMPFIRHAFLLGERQGLPLGAPITK